MATLRQRVPRLSGIFAAPERVLQFQRLAAKGIQVRVPVLKVDDWKRLTAADPAVPRSFAQLKALSRRLFDRELRKLEKQQRWMLRPRAGLLRTRVEECGEAAHATLFAGLSNPFLNPAQRANIESDMDADTPAFESSTQTTHFDLKWTNQSANANDNIANGQIVTDTGGFLEDAWTRYAQVFGRDPYVPAGATRIEVQFHDISGYGVASPPDGPIQFDAKSWVDLPGIRRPTSAHELFHKLQYAFGYRRTWNPTGAYKWFSEGMASWAEVFMWQRVSGGYKINDLFTDPDLNLYDASYSALPFWIFYEARQKSDATDQPILSYLRKYELDGDEEHTLADAIADEWAAGNAYRTLPNFFALFARERRIGAWKLGPTGNLYGNILDPDDAALAPALVTVDVPLESGDTYTNSSFISALGTDYYSFQLGATTAGQTLTVSVDAAAGTDQSYYLMYYRAGQWLRALFPPGLSGDYSLTESIDLAQADQVTLAISGRGIGGAYAIQTSVT
jgi:hypothetical protein